MCRRSRPWLVLVVSVAVLVGLAMPAGAASTADQALLDEIADCKAGNLPFEVFMKVDATDAQIAAVRAAVDEIPRVHITRVLSKDEAYAEFKRIFAKKPDLVNSISAADLSVSIRAKVVRKGRIRTDLPAAVTRVRDMPGVDSLQKPGDLLCPLVSRLSKAGRSPKEIVRILRAEGLA